MIDKLISQFFKINTLTALGMSKFFGSKILMITRKNLLVCYTYLKTINFIFKTFGQPPAVKILKTICSTYAFVAHLIQELVFVQN